MILYISTSLLFSASSIIYYSVHNQHHSFTLHHALHIQLTNKFHSERVEYGLPLVTITEQELREVREGYATGPRLKVFEKNPGDAPCRVRITMWELIVINDNRRLFKTAPPIVLGDSIPDIVRWTASDKYEAGLKKKLAARMAADGGN